MSEEQAIEKEPKPELDESGTPYKLAKSVAEEEFARMCKKRRVIHDMSTLSKFQQLAFAPYRDEVIRAIRKGHVVVSEDGVATYSNAYTTAAGEKPFVFGPVDGSTLMAGEEYAEKQPRRHNFHMLAAMTKHDMAAFAKLEAPEIAVLSSMLYVFLGSR